MPQINLSNEMLKTLALAVDFGTMWVEADYKDATPAERTRIMKQCDEFTGAALMLNDLAKTQPLNK